MKDKLKQFTLLASILLVSPLTLAQEGQNLYRTGGAPDRLEIQPSGNGQNIYGDIVVPEGPSFSDGFQFNYTEDSLLSSSKLSISSPWTGCSSYTLTATALDANGGSTGTCGSLIAFDTPFITGNALPEEDNLTISATVHLGGRTRVDGISTVNLGGVVFKITSSPEGIPSWLATAHGNDFDLPFSGGTKIGFDIEYIKVGSDFTIEVDGNIIGSGVVTDHTLTSFMALGRYSAAGISNIIIDHQVADL